LKTKNPQQGGGWGKRYNYERLIYEKYVRNGISEMRIPVFLDKNLNCNKYLSNENPRS